MINNKLICPACNRTVYKLVKHHWYELPDLLVYEKEICSRCNSLLISANFYSERFHKEHNGSTHHILPSWEKQFEYIQTHPYKEQEIENKNGRYHSKLWIKIDVREWLRGYFRTITPEARGLWIDLLALAASTNKKDGKLKISDNIIMDKEYIINILRISPEELDKGLELFSKYSNNIDRIPMLKIHNDGLIEITHFEEY
jgi:hypothetical protein